MKGFYNENCKTLKKEIEEDTSRWRDLLCSYIRRLNIEKCVPFQNILQIQCNPHQNSSGVLLTARESNSKILRKAQKTPK
jgi:hypothetical protein